MRRLCALGVADSFSHFLQSLHLRHVYAAPSDSFFTLLAIVSLEAGERRPCVIGLPFALLAMVSLEAGVRRSCVLGLPFAFLAMASLEGP